MPRSTTARKRRSDFPADHLEADTSLDVELLILDYLAYQALECTLPPPTAASKGKKRDVNGNVKHAATPNKNEDALHAVDSFLKIFASHHHKSAIQPITHFRLILLRFSELFTSVTRSPSAPLTNLVNGNHSPASNVTLTTKPDLDLTLLRCGHRKRAQAWWDARRAAYLRSEPSPSTPPPPSQDREQADRLAKLINQIDYGNDEASSTTSEEDEGLSPTLLDLLPLFVELTNERAWMRNPLGNCDSEEEGNGRPWPMSEAWVEMAVEFMAHAFLEQRVVCKAKGRGPMLEAFAWGPICEGNEEEEQDGDVEMVDSMEVGEKADYDRKLQDIFLVEENLSPSVVTEQESMDGDMEESRLSSRAFELCRERTLSDLQPRLDGEEGETMSSEELSDIYADLLDSNPLFSRPDFEEKIWEFLRGLAKSIDRPILKQLEEVQDGKRTTMDWGGRRFTSEETERLRVVWSKGQDL